MAGQQERKGSRAAMAGRQNGKRKATAKGKGKEVRVEEFGQQFRTVFSAPESAERLRIPQPFSQYLENQPTGLVFLKGQSGNRWLVELASDSEGLFFGHGWKEFVVDHTVEAGDILNFCYDGYSQFSVAVFDGMCIEKPSAFHAKPSKEISAATEEEYMLASCNSTEDSDSSNRVLEESISRKYSSKSLSDRAQSPVGHLRNKVTMEKDPHITIQDSQQASPMFRFYKDVDDSGKTVVNVQRGPEVMSQRPSVNEEQKNYALQKAKQYKSKYPITLQIMKETHVYKTFFMIIPCEFVREHLPHTDKKLTLWDPQGKPWEVTYVYCSQRLAGAFSKGWGKFSLGNHLEKFDVCVFELFSKDNIKVHIYRANPGLTPYMIDS